MAIEIGKLVYCIDESIYSHAISKRKSYMLLDIDWVKNQVSIKSNKGRKSWFPMNCFSESKCPEIVSITIDDKINDSLNDCIEVTITFSNNQKGYATFATPAWITQLLKPRRDYVLGTNLIFVKELTQAQIEKTIYELDKQNELTGLIIHY